MHTWYKLRIQRTIAQYRSGDGEFYHHPILKNMVDQLCDAIQVTLSDAYPPGEKTLAAAYADYCNLTDTEQRKAAPGMELFALWKNTEAFYRNLVATFRPLTYLYRYGCPTKFVVLWHHSGRHLVAVGCEEWHRGIVERAGSLLAQPPYNIARCQLRIHGGGWMALDPKVKNILVGSFSEEYGPYMLEEVTHLIRLAGERERFKDYQVVDTGYEKPKLS